MGISTMGVHSALRTYQDTNSLPGKQAIVDGLASPTGNVVGLPDKKPGVGDDAASKLETLAAWIPTETLALWIALTAGFSLFEDMRIEAIVGGVLLVSSGVLGFLASHGAHTRRPLDAAKTERRKKAISTGCVAAVAFAIYWMAMPGSLFTADLGWPPVFPALLLGLTLVFLPLVARALGIEPRKES